MEVGIGERIRSERRLRAWDQADLAKRLGVGQQTVSRWERGLSRPRPTMVAAVAALFDVDATELLIAGCYASTVDGAEQARPPVRPRLTVLPVGDLSPDRFEELVADVVRHRYPDAHVSRFGVSGHKQHGVDVVAQQGRLTLATFQCKRRKQFGPKDVRDAVGAVNVEATAHFLLLTRPASPDCRTEMSKHDGWTLWDVEDLSRAIRFLSLDDAVRIVDTYFPGWREPLLGVAEPGPWLACADFFRTFGSSQIYTHNWKMVGRATELDDILKFLDGSRGQLGLVVGRGGIGKSRLLREVATQAEARSIKVRFLTTGAELKPEHFELLPTDCPLLVILDDAHDRTDVAAAIRAIVQLRPNARVLLAIRPYGLSHLASDLRTIGVHPTEMTQWELLDLTHKDAETLAREALGSEWSEQLVRRLGRLTADCPLITVVGGLLIRRGDLDPNCLDHEDTIRNEILRAFRDVLVADPLSGDPVLRRAVFNALAVLQPFRINDPAFQTTLVNLIGAPFYRANSHIKGLEDAGVVLRRGVTLRIVPDLLGDVILAEACFDERSGFSTGYIERARAGADGEPLQHIFVNTMRIDWQVRHDHGDGANLVGALWDTVEGEIKAAGIRGRRSLLKLLQKVAYFAPDRTLEVARWIIDNPTGALEDGNELEKVFLQMYPPSYDDVLHELPPLLRAVAYNFDHFVASADMLWELGRIDTRPTHQYPEHAVRVLRDLAELRMGKPLAFNHALIGAAERWLHCDDVEGCAHSPFDVLEPMLVTEGTENTFEGFNLVFKPFSLNLETVAPMRERIIALALREATSSSVRRAVRAVEAVETAVRYPRGLFGRQVADAERDAWTPNFVDILRRLGRVMANPHLDPVVAVAARRALQWHANHSTTATREVAQCARNGLPSTLEHQLAVVLFHGWGRLVDGPAKDYETAEADRQGQMKDFVEALVADLSVDEMIGTLTRRVRNQTAAFESPRGSPGQFIWTLVTTRPSIGLSICAHVAAEPTSVLLQLLPIVIAALAESSPAEVIPAVADLLQTNSCPVRQQVAQALGWNRGPRATLLDGEQDILLALAEDSDQHVRANVGRAAQRLAPHHRLQAISLVARIPFGDSPTVAEEVFRIFGQHGELEWQEIPADRAEAMLADLRNCPSIENYTMTTFLATLSIDQPAVVVELLMARVEHWEKTASSSQFDPLPHHWDHPLQLRQHPDFFKSLRWIRQWIAQEPDSMARVQAGGDLFSAVAHGFDATVLAVLEEGVATGDAGQLAAVAALLQRGPGNLVYDEVEFVRRALGAASKLGEDAVQRIGGALTVATGRGGRIGIPGQPFAEDLEQRDRARAIADLLPRDSIEQRFYLSLQESAEHSIEWARHRDDRVADGRDW